MCLRQPPGVLNMLRDRLALFPLSLDAAEGFGLTLHGVCETTVAVVYEPLWTWQSAMLLHQQLGVVKMFSEQFVFSILRDSGKGFGMRAHSSVKITVAMCLKPFWIG